MTTCGASTSRCRGGRDRRLNRSHYEDVLVPVVNGWITPAQKKQRLAHINDFERC